VSRVVSSVPNRPTTVVIPPPVRSPTPSGGTLLPGPDSPPPPVTWTCPSINPGMARRPSKSMVSTPRAPGSSGSSGPSQTICSPATNKWLTPNGSGAKISKLRSSCIMLRTGVLESEQGNILGPARLGGPCPGPSRAQFIRLSFSDPLVRQPAGRLHTRRFSRATARLLQGPLAHVVY